MTNSPASRLQRWRAPLVFGAGACIVAAALGIYAGGGRDGNAPSVAAMAPLPASAAGVTKGLSTGPLAAFVVHPQRKMIAGATFEDEAGKPRSLADWNGRVVLVNLWATWCAPCRKEMPELAALQSKLGSDAFEVVAVSVDRKGKEASEAFLKEAKAESLKLYLDPSTKILDQLKAVGLPATVLVDRQGYEVGRLLGPAAWSSPEAVRLIEAALAEGKSATQ